MNPCDPDQGLFCCFGGEGNGCDCDTGTTLTTLAGGTSTITVVGQVATSLSATTTQSSKTLASPSAIISATQTASESTAPESSTQSGGVNSVALGAGLGVPLVALALGGILFAVYRHQKHQRPPANEHGIASDQDLGLDRQVRGVTAKSPSITRGERGTQELSGVPQRAKGATPKELDGNSSLTSGRAPIEELCGD